MLTKTREAERVETGGILAGVIEPGPGIRVIRASDAGPRAVQTPGHVRRDTAHVQALLDRWHAEMGIDYVGEWHSHTFPGGYPSQEDLEELQDILRDPDYRWPEVAMLIVAPRFALMPARLGLFGYIAIREDIFRAAIAVES